MTAYLLPCLSHYSSSSDNDDEADRFRHSNSNDDVEFGSQRQVLTGPANHCRQVRTTLYA